MCRKRAQKKKVASAWVLIYPEELSKKKSTQILKKISKDPSSTDFFLIPRAMFLNLHRKFFYSLHQCDDFSDFEDTFRYSYNPPEKKMECLCARSSPCPICEILPFAKKKITDFGDVLVLQKKK